MGAKRDERPAALGRIDWVAITVCPILCFALLVLGEFLLEESKMSKQSMEEHVRKETIFGLVPVKKSERTYGFWDTLLVTSGFAIAAWYYSQGALSASYLDF